MRSTSRPDDRVNLVHDHRARRPQHLTAPLCRQQQVQRLWRRHQDVRWRAQHRCALGGRCIAGANRSRDAGDVEAGLFSQLAQCASRLGQVLVDVSAQRLQRRHIHDADGVGQRRFETFPDEIVDRRQKCREGLARAGGRGDERVLTGTDRRPAAALCGRRLSERIEKPARNQRMEPGHHGWEGPCGDFDPIISNLSLHRGQGDERVLTRLAGIFREPLGPAAEIGQPPIELRVPADRA